VATRREFPDRDVLRAQQQQRLGSWTDVRDGTSRPREVERAGCRRECHPDSSSEIGKYCGNVKVPLSSKLQARMRP
jgi:hypothetical protein